jgi:flagellar biosynthesis/type III secretory pathway protein FliH
MMQSQTNEDYEAGYRAGKWAGIAAGKLVGFEDGYDKGYDRGFSIAEGRWKRKAEMWERLLSHMSEADRAKYCIWDKPDEDA